jgi:choline dehydrogenase-like flavoprotein
MTFVDANEWSGRVIEADLAVVGSGAAGLALAREFAGSGIKVALMEAGGFRPNRRNQADYRGRNTGRPSIALTMSRFRCFGGSTTVWGGQSRPLDPIDFEVRDGIEFSGWPFRLADLVLYYHRAQTFCQLGSYDYEPEPSLRLPSNLLSTRLYRFSHPVNLGQFHRETLAQADDVEVYLNTNLRTLRLDRDGSRVMELQVVSGSGRPLTVRAGYYVLACGGIENARLLLTSGIGNQHDLVGRFFMDHPYIFPGYLLPTGNEFPPESFVIPGYDEIQPTQFLHAALGLQESVIRAERLNGASVYLVQRRRYKTSGAYWSRGGRALLHLIEVLQRRDHLDGRLPRDLTDLVTDFPNAARTGWDRVAGLLIRDEVPALRVAVEATPCPESRVRLGRSTDRWGMPSPEVYWRLNDRDRLGIRRLLDTVRSELSRLNLARMVEHGRHDPDGWPSGMIGGKHHMGTTRMHADPRQGVVDPDCRVHGMMNLSVAGSSVFPTGGYANPTLTIVALAIRLADHLKALLRPARA